MMKKIFNYLSMVSVSFKRLLGPALIIIALAGCKKNNAAPAGQQTDDGTINFVLSDNFTFTVFNSGLQIAGLQDTLGKKGPYTILAPNNTAFTSQGFNGNLNFYSTFYPDFRGVMLYHILRQRLSFKELGFSDNKAYTTANGNSVYISKYMDGSDTVVTVNGFKVVSEDNPATNGLIQVMPQFMNEERYPTVTGHIRNDTTLTLFAVALQRSGLDASELSGSGTYTVLAPSNAAFQASAKLGLNLGLSTVDSILMADPQKLANILKYHILNGRYFDGQLFRLAAASSSAITMQNGGTVTVSGDPNGYNMITFLGRGNTTPSGIQASLAFGASIINCANIPCGNGVVHIINRLLIP